MRASEDSGGDPTAGGKFVRFFADRWNGNAPLGRLFWRDMLVVGSALNVAATLASLGLLAAKVPLAAALGVHALPIPYNVFLAFAVWRTAERHGGALTLFYQLAAVAWLVVAIVI
jgi:hypothetical protein